MVCFFGSEWSDSADYIFFRNNTPDRAKLSTQLVASPHRCAYCCQCAGASADAEVEAARADEENASVRGVVGLQWICTGHSS